MSALRQWGPPLLSGVLFGAGLSVGGMTNPERVRGFLDLFGDWDPTLAFVMAGAVVAMAVAWRLQAQMVRPWFAARFALPDRSDLDPALVVGAALFGIGWGLAGLCPGPALASLALSPTAVLPFVLAMLAGMAIHRFLTARAPRILPRGT